MNEIWKPIPGTENMYEVSDLGSVRSHKWGNTKIMHPIELKRSGHLVVKYVVNNKVKQVYLHRLVADLFLPNPDSERYTQIKHKNGIRTQCDVDNLEWEEDRYTTYPLANGGYGHGKRFYFKGNW